jgi:hypothetical protein
MLALLVEIFQTVIKELVGLAWRRANEPSLSTDAKKPPGNLYERFARRVRRHQSGVRPPNRP